MPRSMVALLAAEAAAMAALAQLAHGSLFWVVLGLMVAATALVTYATAPEPSSLASVANPMLSSTKKNL
jgi:hypothetical protein